MAAKNNIIADVSEVVDISTLKPYGKNPRKGDVKAISESMEENGQFRPIVVNRSTMEILAGNHTWKAAQVLGWKQIQVVFVDVDEERAKRIVLADNRTNDLSTYDPATLAEILDSLPSPAGTGYDDSAVRHLLAGMQDRDQEVLEQVVRPMQVTFEPSDDDDDTEWDLSSHIAKEKERHDRKFGDDGSQALPSMDDTEKARVAKSIADLQYEFDKHVDTLFPSSNYWGIPDLRRDMLVDTLPDPLKTWGGDDATPDDGVSTYLWNAGLASSRNLPWDRAIISFFTYDTKFEPWMDQPSFQVARAMFNGARQAIVPDTSFWTDDTRFHHLCAAYNAQWMGRFMQECGMKMIPRFMWCDLESIKVGTLGIPKAPPVAAVCIQAIDKKEAEKQMTAEGLRAFVKEIQPEALIVYGGGTARKVAEDAVLPKSLHVVHVESYSSVRRGVVFDNATGKEAVEKAGRKAKREAARAASRTGSPDAPTEAAEEE